MSTPEGVVLKACMQYLSLCGIFHFRNNTGGTPLHDGSGGYRPGPKSSIGSPDIIGIARERVSGEAFPLSVEVKSATGRQSPAQREFQRKWERAGGFYLLVRSVEDLRKGLRDAGVEVR